MASRSGSFPFMNIAEDFDLPYWVVLSYAGARRKVITAGNAVVSLSIWERWAYDEVHYAYAHTPDSIRLAQRVDGALGSSRRAVA